MIEYIKIFIVITLSSAVILWLIYSIKYYEHTQKFYTIVVVFIIFSSFYTVATFISFVLDIVIKD